MSLYCVSLEIMWRMVSHLCLLSRKHCGGQLVPSNCETGIRQVLLVTSPCMALGTNPICLCAQTSTCHRTSLCSLACHKPASTAAGLTGSWSPSWLLSCLIILDATTLPPYTELFLTSVCGHFCPRNSTGQCCGKISSPARSAFLIPTGPPVKV
jgi:hypothetical protein